MCFSLQRRAIFPHLNFEEVLRTRHFSLHFDLPMRFSLQRRAMFRHRNFKKWSEPAVFCTFWLANVLLATTACNFSTFELQKVVRRWGFCAFWLENVLLATTACNFKHLPPHPPLYRFTEPVFRPSRLTNHRKNTAFRDFRNISRSLIFFLLALAHLYLLSFDSISLLCFFSFWLCYFALLFQLSIFSEVRLLIFLWSELSKMAS